jgi:aspartyl-tRNA(Asn)/glutamyl-tRNA(Gln) amidotransferase subunit C
MYNIILFFLLYPFMPLTNKDIQKISQLAKINIDQKNEAELLKKLHGILDLIDAMQKIDTSNVEPMSHALDISQPLRDDEISETTNKEKFLNLSKEANKDYFIVPRVVD